MCSVSRHTQLLMHLSQRSLARAGCLGNGSPHMQPLFSIEVHPCPLCTQCQQSFAFFPEKGDALGLLWQQLPHQVAACCHIALLLQEQASNKRGCL